MIRVVDMVCTINGTSNIDQMFPHFVDHVILEWIFTHVSGVTSLQGIL